MWTEFMDMHSGGFQKEPYSHIYIEAPEDKAVVIFYNIFGHNPNRVTCTCCGPDYSILESDSFDEATRYWRKGKSIEEYTALEDVRIIPASEITDDMREGEASHQGYYWVD